MAHSREGHAEAIINRYRGRAPDGSATESLAEGDREPRGQLPRAVLELAPDELRTFDVAVGYIDLRRFTWRTFVDDDLDTARLARAFLHQCAEIIADRGGYVIGPRGDGLMFAVGSDGDAAHPKTMCALGAAAFALDMTANALNEQLEAEGLRPVQARAGVDYGSVVFGWCLDGQLNPNAFPANFASKCEKDATAWQVIVGDGAEEAVGDSAIATIEPHGDPSTYTLDGVTHTYRAHRWKWEENSTVRGWAAELPTLLAGRRPDDLTPLDVLGTPERLGPSATKTLGRDGQVRVNTGRGQPAHEEVAIKPHDFHSTTTAGEPVKGSQRPWWRQDAAALKAEKAAMEAALPGFVYAKRDGHPSWTGTLRTTSRTYRVRVTYWHPERTQLPVVEILDPPDLNADSTGRPMAPEHYSRVLPWGRNVPCVAAPDDWDPPHTTVVDVLGWTADWLVAYETWCSGRVWPGERLRKDKLV